VPTGEAVFHEQEILCNIAGGIPSTFPYEGDLTNPEIKATLEKYLLRNPKIPIEDQIKFWLSFIDYSCSSATGSMNYGNYHGGVRPSWNRSPSHPNTTSSTGNTWLITLRESKN
jgi:aromatic ring hydroxylase